MSKNVAVFVDVANIFYAAKAAGVDIDYVTLLKASSAGRDLVRAYAYTGLDPDNENQRNFHDFLRRHGYKVVSKDIRKYGDGKVKANLDIELVVDMMKTARNLDIAIVVSGDGDFAPAIRAVQEMGVRVEVVSFRGNTSSDLIEVADIFTDITQIAKVEKGSSRSGRRVATDDEDLSMTEVPDKMTEGTGDGRRRGRGGRTRTGEPAAARGSRRTAASREAEREASREEPVAAEGTLVVLPGEKLSRVRPAAARPAKLDEVDELDAEVAELAGDEEPTEGLASETEDGAVGEDSARRRRRRRGGRGRGRGRGRTEGQEAVEGPAPEGPDDTDEVEVLPAPAPRRAAFSFGSVWDSQIGVPASPAAASGTSASPRLGAEEDLEEPEIPEYLLAERRQRDSARGGRGGARGGRGGGRGSAYAAAMDRERFGAGGRGGSTPSRYAEPGQRREVREVRGGQPSRPAARSFDRPERAPRPSGGDPWSEVPPEIEAMLRAQLASSGGRPVRQAPVREAPAGRPAPEAATRARASAGDLDRTTAGEPAAAAKATRAPARRGTRTTKPVADASAAPAMAVSEPAAAPATRRRRTSAGAAAGGSTTGTEAAGDSGAGAAPKATRRRASAAKPAAAGESGSNGTAGAAEATPKRRATRKKADASA
ncbi:MAG: NYN domain-containing protein [Chloroflexi bacterium]|nr:NYN domain-containing protein [Chloroflexota bacterium]